MARYRTIKPKFWDDLKLSKISRDARLTYIALWNFADDNGVIIAEPTWLKSKIYPYDKIQLPQFEKWLLDLLTPGFINLFSFNKEEFYYLPNFAKHQVINKPNFEDVFVPKDKLEELLRESRINHGSITDQSRPEKRGEEKRKEERRGEREKPPPSQKILFRESFFFDIEKFKNEFLDTKYSIYNLEFYYEKVLNWSNSSDAKKVDWIATARNFMLGDAEKGKAILQNQNLTQNGNRNSKNTSANLADYAAQLARDLE